MTEAIFVLSQSPGTLTPQGPGVSVVRHSLYLMAYTVTSDDDDGEIRSSTTQRREQI
jgi:hypothetical protein